MTGLDLCRLIGEIDESHVERAFSYDGTSAYIRHNGNRSKVPGFDGLCSMTSHKPAIIMR